MHKSVKLLNVLIFTLIVYESNAKLLSCSYHDTVDISYLKGVDDYFGQVPVNGTVEHLCRETTNACVCKGLNCVGVCCSRTEFIPIGECIYNQVESPNRKKDILSKSETLREYPSCHGHTLLENETIAIKIYQLTESGYIIDIYKYTTICCKMRPAVLVLGVISVICYVLTIAAYLYFKQLRNIVGKCFSSCLVCMCMKCIFWLLDDQCLLNRNNAVKGYLAYFFWIASFLWFLVLNHVIWKHFIVKDRNLPQSRVRFKNFCSFVWLTAAICTVLIYFVNYFWEKNAKYMFSYFIQFDAADSSYTIAFYYIGMMIVSLINMVCSILVVRNVKEVLKVELKERNILRYLFWLRLPTKLGVFWSLDLILCVMQTYRVFPHFLWVADYFHAAIGIQIFLLFVVRRKILEWLRKEDPVEVKPLTVDTFGGETSF
ncbi:probable G-protein coupled receptor Mth-like 7 [Drosophila yakuba]|uniref:probable G-protein coupled receptor Mth-like 7 n=1 Tax=Drosophila yakuba TaxID=7245 RepID=UPI0019307528|nr:probable G-protein coupled receptor Mth-like 7 [Drosophila yakuba]